MPERTFANGFDRLIISWLVGHTVKDVECELIVRTLSYRRGCRTRAARDLNISIRTLRNKIREYESLGIPVARPVPPASLLALAPPIKVQSSYCVDWPRQG